MIKKLINKLFSKKITDEEIECAIDEQIVDCAEIDADPYVGVPAPILSPVDDWFGSAPTPTEKQKEYQQQEATQRLHDDIRRESETNESENIHQLMYEMATKSGATTVQLDPLGGSENFQGGSENIQK
jgi:hypothetical protein|tara:strand:+ start:1249 stop:1632 length:384 start_codon:yes stop_codon:yes gene_type:complete